MSFFRHEDLKAYQKSLEWNAWITPKLKVFSQRASLASQVDKASSSIALNIAEGNGKYSKRDKSRFFQIACGSALECSACLDLANAGGMITEEDVVEGKTILVHVVNLLYGLVRSLFPEKVEEEPMRYGSVESWLLFDFGAILPDLGGVDFD